MIPPDASALNARNRLIAMFAALCILDAVLVAIARDAWAIGRIVITIALMYFVVQGRKWAKWTLMGILSLVTVLLLALLFALSSELSTVLTVGSLMMIVLTVATMVYLVRSQALNRYFSRQRQIRSQSLLAEKSL